MEERHTHEERGEARRQSRERRLRRHKLWRAVRPLLVGLVSIGICMGILWGGIKLALEEFIYPVDVNDATPVVVTTSTCRSMALPPLPGLRSCGSLSRKARKNPLGPLSYLDNFFPL